MRRCAVILPLIVLLPLRALADDLALVKDGKPSATVVISASANDKVKVASADLVTYIEKMSGAKLPLVTDDQKTDGALVLVGRSKLTDTMELDIPSGFTSERRDEGFVIRCNGNRLVLAGNDDGLYHGTEYAVYEFLNRLGVRWFMPGDFGEVVPKKTTITCGEMNVREKPDFVMRNWWCHLKPELVEDEKRWKIRNKMNPERDLFATPGDSSVRNIVKSDLVKEKPELFALNADGTRNPHYPNLTNPEAVKAAADIIKEHFRQHPEANSYGFAPDDGMPRDYNPETMKLNLGITEVLGRPGVPAEVSTSEEWFRFVNAVTAEVRKDFADKFIATNGYANRDIPPLGVPLDDHLVVMFAAIWSCTLHGYDAPNCWQKVRQGEMLERWAKLCRNTWVYSYHYQMLVSGLTPLPEFTKMKRDFPLMHKWGVMGFLDETRNVWAENGIASRYLRARLEWDAEADVDKLLDDFFSTWYGPAAQAMRAYWTTLDQAIANGQVHGHEDRVLPELYTQELMNKLGDAIDTAVAAAKQEPYLTRVQADQLVHQHLVQYVKMNAAEVAGKFDEAALAGLAMMDLRGKLHQISHFFVWPDENGYHTGVWYWKVTDRMKWYQEQADKLNGTTGTQVALCPTEAQFRLDPHDEGFYESWYDKPAEKGKWTTIRTDRPFWAQGYQDAQGHPYIGNMWYRLRVDVPRLARGQRVMLMAPCLTTEGWCWVNGKYVGYRPYLEAYIRPAPMEVEVTDAVRPDETNEIVFRINTSLSEAQIAEGLYGRVFLYSPR